MKEIFDLDPLAPWNSLYEDRLCGYCDNPTDGSMYCSKDCKRADLG